MQHPQPEQKKPNLLQAHESDDGGLEEDEDLTKELEQQQKNKSAQPPYVLSDKELQEHLAMLDEIWDDHSECNGYVVMSEATEIVTDEVARKQLHSDLPQLDQHFKWFEVDSTKKLLPSEWKKIFAAPLVKIKKLNNLWKNLYNKKLKMDKYYGKDTKESFAKFVEFKDEIWEDLSESFGFAKYSDIKADLAQWMKIVNVGDEEA